MSEELDKLHQLYNDGSLSDEEYEAAKARLLGQSNSFITASSSESSQLLGLSPNSYAMAMHLSQYAGYVVPLAGMVIPIAMWLYGRDYNEFVNEQGRNMMNFLISYIIYLFIAGLLCFIVIGFVVLPIVLLIDLILPIFAAIAASKGQSYRYPMTIKFF